MTAFFFAFWGVIWDSDGYSFYFNPWPSSNSRRLSHWVLPLLGNGAVVVSQTDADYGFVDNFIDHPYPIVEAYSLYQCLSPGTVIPWKAVRFLTTTKYSSKSQKMKTPTMACLVPVPVASPLGILRLSEIFGSNSMRRIDVWTEIHPLSTTPPYPISAMPHSSICMRMPIADLSSTFGVWLRAPYHHDGYQMGHSQNVHHVL
mgnify:CR=1 FL=1